MTLVQIDTAGSQQLAARADFALPRRQAAILPAAEAADRMAEHLQASFSRVGTLDVVARREIEGAIRALDRMFAVETQRFAYFHEDPEDFLDSADLACGLTAAQSAAIVDLFADPGVSVISSFLNMDDEALAESLEFGLTRIDWEGNGRSRRELLIDQTGSKLPVAYLRHVFRRATSRLQGLLESQIGLERWQAVHAAAQIRQSVIIETMRAGAAAGERLETLASWLLTLQGLDGAFLTRLIARGAHLSLMTLLSVASGVPEGDIRESAWSKESGGLHEACRRIGIDEEMADFLLSAIIESRRLGKVSSAADLATFCPEMSEWIRARADESHAPATVVEASLTISDWDDWDPPTCLSGTPRTAQIISFPTRA